MFETGKTCLPTKFKFCFWENLQTFKIYKIYKIYEKDPKSLLWDISTFEGWDSTKLEDWLTNLKMAPDILKESQACLAKATSCGFTHTLIHEALQA